jgi:hypothetical protein
MPRQAAAAQAFTVNGSTRAMLKPPDDLAPSHFLPSDVPLIAAYAKAIVAERVASGELAAAYVIDDKPSPWLPIWQAKVRALTTLARMLSLSPGGRVASKPSDEQPISYYEKMALLEGRRDDDPN